MGKSGRLTWGCKVLAVEPGRLPASNRFRESHGRERAPLPLLDTQTPTHLNDMGFLVARIFFRYRLRTDGENMLEKTRVRSTPKKVFTHRHEGSKVRDGIGRKVMELCTKEIQESLEEGERRK